MLSIFGTLLGWLNPLSAILGQIQQWEAKLLDAKTEQERIAAQERIAWYQAAATIAGHPIDMVLRALMAAPGILFVWKLIVYDKMLGWGSTLVFRHRAPVGLLFPALDGGTVAIVRGGRANAV